MGLPKFFKKILPESWIYSFTLKNQHKSMLNEMTFEEWEKRGKPMPPPAFLKRDMMKKYAEKYHATRFIETGTFMGDTSFVMKDYFKSVDTIELDEKLAQRATQRFASIPNVKVWQGDSGKVISDVLGTLDAQTVALFYLDGHFSGGITAKADLYTPISKELDAIFEHSKNHVIFIDDARLFFSNQQDYPPFDELVKQIKMYSPSAHVTIDFDIITIVPFT